MGSQSQTPLRQLLISKQLTTALRRRREEDGVMGRGPQGGWERAETEQRGGLRSNPVAAALSPCDDRTQYGPLHASPARSTCRSWAQWVNTGPHSCADQSSVPAGVPRGCHSGSCKSLCRALSPVPRVLLTEIPILAGVQLWTSGQPAVSTEPIGQLKRPCSLGRDRPPPCSEPSLGPVPPARWVRAFWRCGQHPSPSTCTQTWPATRDAGNQSLGSQEAMRTGPRLEAKLARGSLEGEAADPGGGTGQTQLWPRLQGRGRESDRAQAQEDEVQQIPFIPECQAPPPHCLPPLPTWPGPGSLQTAHPTRPGGEASPYADLGGNASTGIFTPDAKSKRLHSHTSVF